MGKTLRDRFLIPEFSSSFSENEKPDNCNALEVVLHAKTGSEDKQKEVVDFVEFLKAKEKNDLYKRMDVILEQHTEAFRELAK